MKRTGLSLVALPVFILLCVTCIVPSFAQTAGSAATNSGYYRIGNITLDNGKTLVEQVINSPPQPPAEFQTLRMAVALPEPDAAAGIQTLTVPAYTWVYGCSAVSGAMIAAYYDRTGFPNMYTGPANLGVMPLSEDSSWGTWTDSALKTYPNNPLVASHKNVDGRSDSGSIDDYWVSYNSSAQDPWKYFPLVPQHAWGDAIGDYMKTSQSGYGNSDGWTKFYYTGTADALTCSDMENSFYGGMRISYADGTYGRKLFYEARGYVVGDCYNRNTDNNGGGFTFAMYKAEIDAGRPVLLNLTAHSVVGVGYSDPNTVYFNDTWDSQTHTMTWGGSYSASGYAGSMQAVSIVSLTGEVMTTTTTVPTTSTTSSIRTTTTTSVTTSIPHTTTTQPVTTTTSQPSTTTSMPPTTTTAMPGTPLSAGFSGCQELDSPGTVQFLNESSGTIASWIWNFGDGNTSTDQNPLHTYIMNGNYSVSLTMTDTYGRTDYAVEDSCVSIGSCDIIIDFTATPVRGASPLIVTFTPDILQGTANQYFWSFGDGGTSTAQSPTHVYQSKGDYVVLLMARRGNECAASVVKEKFIHVSGSFGILSDLCPLLLSVSNRAGSDQYASALRNFRDYRLNTANGAFLTMLYYVNSPEVVRILEHNPDLAREFGDIVEAYAPRIGQGLALGAPAAFNPLEITRVESLLESIGRKGSPLLKVSIRYVLRQMKQPGGLRQFGIEALQ